MDTLLVGATVAFAGAGVCGMLLKRLNGKAPANLKLKVTGLEYDYMERKLYVSVLNTTKKAQKLGYTAIRQMVPHEFDAPEGMLAGTASSRTMYALLGENANEPALEPKEERWIEFPLLADYGYSEMDVEIKGVRVALPQAKLTTKPFDLKKRLAPIAEEPAKEVASLEFTMDPLPVLEEPKVTETVTEPLPVPAPEPLPELPSEPVPEEPKRELLQIDVCDKIRDANISLDVNWKDFTVVTMDEPRPIEPPTIGLARILDASGMSEKELVYLVIAHLNQEQMSVETRIARLEELL